MPSTRKFYRTTIKVEVLSEGPIDPVSLAEVGREIVSGDWCGSWKIVESKEVSAGEMVWLLGTHASEPAFFGLDAVGDDLDSEVKDAT